MPSVVLCPAISEVSATLAREMQRLNIPASEVFVVCDQNVALNFGVFGQLGFPTFLLSASESVKTFETVVSICQWLISLEASRSALLVAVGGGVTSDICGFAASIYKRGIRYANIPSTLLAQVDAAIGGKTGVNLDGFKNMLGVIRQPEFILLCPALLSSLPHREFLSGAGELLKTFLISSEENYCEAVSVLSAVEERFVRGGSGGASLGRNDEELRDGSCPEMTCRNDGSGEDFRKGSYDGNSSGEVSLGGSSDDDFRLSASEIARLTPLILAAAQFKSSIVSKDPFENDLRRILNFGHTYAHALEWWQRQVGRKYFTHGEAVAIGMVTVLRVTGQTALAERLAADLRRCGLPTDLPCPLSSLDPALAQDKKLTSGKLHLVTLTAIGQVTIA